jgi:hypothetical protein
VDGYGWTILQLLLLAPTIILLGYILWQRYRPLFLKRQATFTPPDITKLPTKAVEKQIFQLASLSRTAQQLRKHKPIPTTDLDITATLKKTIEMAGWFTPITGTIPIRPEYLVLIDRTTFKDHQAELMNSLINQIIAEEVFVTRYYFDGDPRRCYPEQVQLAPLTLTELAERYPEHQLMIFSDGNGFINPITGEIVNWIEQFSVWTPRTLFTLEEPAHWGYREQILDEVDFLIMPANETGLMKFAEHLSQREAFSSPLSQQTGAKGEFAEFPDYINERPRRWLERHAPETTVLTELLKQVRDFLGEEAYDWFKACAVYPELRWQLTLYLGEQLKWPLRDNLAKLARLPWFRYGYMPDWLRAQLVKELPPKQKKRIHAISQDFLQPTSDTSQKDSQEIATESSRSRTKSGLSKDYVFATFMKDNLSVEVPTASRQQVNPSKPTTRFSGTVKNLLERFSKILPSKEFLLKIKTVFLSKKFALVSVLLSLIITLTQSQLGQDLLQLLQKFFVAAASASDNQTIIGVIVSILILLLIAWLLLYKFKYHRPFKPKLEWEAANKIEIDFNNKPAGSKSLIGRVIVRNEAKVPWFGKLLGNKDYPDYQVKFSLDYEDKNLRDGGFIASKNAKPFGFTTAVKQGPNNTISKESEKASEALKRKANIMDSQMGIPAQHTDSTSFVPEIEERVSHETPVHVFLATDGIDDFLWPDKAVKAQHTVTFGGTDKDVQIVVEMWHDNKPVARKEIEFNLELIPEDAKPPQVTYQPSTEKLYRKGQHISIGTFRFQSRAEHYFAYPFEGSFKIQSYKNNRPLANNPVTLQCH